MSKALIRAVAIALIAGISPVIAQQFPAVPAQSVIGRMGIPGDTGPSQSIPFATLAQKLLAIVGLYGIDTLESCGAVGDGIADDAPALRTCGARAGAKLLGGKVMGSCNKTYRLASRSAIGGTSAIAHPYSNVTYEGCGDSTVFKVANGMNTASAQFFVFYPPDSTATYTYTNPTFRNFKIDFNGANNSCGGTCTWQNIGIGAAFGSGATVQGVTFANNPGSTNISFGPSLSDVKIFNTTHLDSCDLINAACTDHSSIFINASDYKISNNTCRYSSQGQRSTCWEMWGLNGTATGNTVSGYAKMANIAALGASAKNITMSGNVGRSLISGVQIWCDGVSSSSLSDVLITGNTLQQSFQLSFPFYDFDTGITAGCASNITFSNNKTNSIVVAGTAGVVPMLRLGRAAGQIIADNTFNGGLGPAIGNGTFIGATSFNIERNSITDAGQSSTAGGRRGILLNSGTSIAKAVISGNNIQNVASAYMTTGMDLTLTASSGWLAPNHVISGIATSVTQSLTGFGVLPLAGVMYAQGFGAPPAATPQMTDGQLLVGQTAGGPLPKTVSGDCVVTLTGAITCTKTNSVTFAAVATSGVKADVGLGNVDNTSDATKNAAAVTLTNKTLTIPIISKGVFSGLATCASGNEGALAAVTDSSTAVWGATITGSSTNHVLAYCDGTNWTVAAK